MRRDESGSIQEEDMSKVKTRYPSRVPWGLVLPPICEYTGYTPKQQDDVFQNLFALREVQK